MVDANRAPTHANGSDIRPISGRDAWPVDGQVGNHGRRWVGGQAHADGRQRRVPVGVREIGFFRSSSYVDSDESILLRFLPRAVGTLPNASIIKILTYNLMHRVTPAYHCSTQSLVPSDRILFIYTNFYKF